METVWGLTLDVESLPALTPTVTAVERLDGGPLVPHSTVRLKQPGQPARTWTVTTIDPGRRFVWQTRALGTVMVATHELSPSDDGSGTINRLVITIEGTWANVVAKMIGRQVRTALAQENAGFKQAAERAAQRGVDASADSA